MRSLKWKIAAWYAALLIVVLTITSGIIVWRFGTIVYAQARDRADATMSQILTTAHPPSSPLGLENAAEPLQVLLNSDNLALWASPTTSVQIDTLSGYPLVKTTNLGSNRIPPANVNAAHPLAFRQLPVRGEPALVEDRYVRVGLSDVVIHVAESLAAVELALAEARRMVAIVLVCAVAAVVLLSIVLASQTINPINELSRAMREIGSDRLDRRVTWRKRDDEIGELAESFDDMLARLEAAFARERQFISDASHELKTPLTSINSNAQMLLRWADRDERVRRESLETIARESASLAEMVNRMLMLAKADRGDDIPKEPVSLIDEARTVTQRATARAQEKGLVLRFEAAAPSAIVLADAHLIRQLIGNLVDNAIKFTERGTIEVRAGKNGDAWVEVCDSGPGIAEGDLPRVFERFYRADRARSRSVPGMGLGLSIVRSIARVHGGTVAVERASQGGACFRVAIPLLDASPSGRAFTDLS